MPISLEERTLRGNLIQTFQLLTGKENVDHENNFNHSTTNLSSRSQFDILKVYHNVTNYVGGDFFSQRVIDVWTSLSEFMVSALSTNIFKNRVDNKWKIIWATYKRLTSSLANAHYL